MSDSNSVDFLQRSLSNCAGEEVLWTSGGVKKKGIIVSLVRANTDITENNSFTTLNLDLASTKISKRISEDDRFLIQVEKEEFTRDDLNLPSSYYAASANVIAKAMNWELNDDPAYAAKLIDDPIEDLSHRPNEHH